MLIVFAYVILPFPLTLFIGLSYHSAIFIFFGRLNMSVTLSCVNLFTCDFTSYNFSFSLNCLNYFDPYVFHVDFGLDVKVGELSLSTRGPNAHLRHLSSQEDRTFIVIDFNFLIKRETRQNKRLHIF